MVGRKVILAVSVFIVTVLPFASGVPTEIRLSMANEFEAKFKVGDTAPEFTTADIDGNEMTLSSFKGKNVVLLNFWGVRCGACIEEMPHLEALHGKYKDKEVVVLGVDIDGIDGDMIKEMLTNLDLKITYTLLTDLDFTLTDTYTNFLVPLTIIIDRQGIIRYIHTGYEEGYEKEYEEALLKILG